MMSDPDYAHALRTLQDQVTSLQKQVASIEARASGAEREAQQARQEVLRLRDQLAAAERDQQELKTARARLARLHTRGLLARILNRR